MNTANQENGIERSAPASARLDVGSWTILIVLLLLLAGTDEMSSIVASASAHADSVFLSTTSVTAIAESVATNDPFVTFLAAILTVAATLALWLELLVRNAAVYVIVLMLPLFFAAMVWPARRTATVG